MKTLLITLIALIALPVSAANIKVNVSAGTGDVKTDLPGNIVDDSELDDIASDFSFAYLMDNNYLLDLSGTFATNDFIGLNIADSIDFSAWSLMAGYHLENDGFYFEPKIGLANWKIEAQEGMLFNPGPEAKQSESGADFAAQLTVGKRFGETFLVNLSYKYIKHDFGQASLYLVGFGLRF